MLSSLKYTPDNYHKLYDIAKNIIERSGTLQEFEQITRVNNIKTIQITYFGFIAIFEHKKLKIILKKINNKKTEFYSVIPCWQTTAHGDLKFMDLALGDPEND